MQPGTCSSLVPASCLRPLWCAQKHEQVPDTARALGAAAMLELTHCCCSWAACLVHGVLHVSVHEIDTGVGFLQIKAVLVEVGVGTVSGFDLSSMNRYLWHPRQERLLLSTCVCSIGSSWVVHCIVCQLVLMLESPPSRKLGFRLCSTPLSCHAGETQHVVPSEGCRTSDFPIPSVLR